MQQDDLNKIIEKSKAKKNGIYVYGSYYYCVIDTHCRLLGEKPTGKIYQFAYGFLSPLGSCEPWYKIKDELKRLMKDL